MCSGSEAGSYLRLIDFVYHSTLGLRVIKKHKLALLMLTLDNSVAMLGYLTMAFGHGTPEQKCAAVPRRART